MKSNIIINSGLKFSLNLEDKTASVVGYDSPGSSITIPRLIQFDKEDFLVTSISIQYHSMI